MPSGGTSANAQTVYNTLRARGYSSAAAAGVIGNLQQESGVNPGSKQVGGAGRGIAQWGTGAGSGGRWDALTAWANSNKKDPYALGTQTDWLLKEMSQRGLGPGSAYAKGTNVSGSTSTFELTYEQAGNVQMASRISYAQNAYNAFGHNAVGPVPKAAPYSSVPGIHGAPATAGKKAPGLGAKAGTQSPIGAALGTLGNLPGDFVAGAGAIGSGIGDGVQAITSPLDAVKKVTTTLFSVSFWIRAAFIIIGVALVFIGTKALLSGSAPTMPQAPQMPATNISSAPTAKKATAKKGFGKSVEGDIGDVGEVAA